MEPYCIDGTMAHYWDIESSNGSMSNGTCRKCNQIKKFHNSIGSITTWREAGQKFKNKQQLTNLGRKDKSNE